MQAVDFCLWAEDVAVDELSIILLLLVQGQFNVPTMKRCFKPIWKTWPFIGMKKTKPTQRTAFAVLTWVEMERGCAVWNSRVLGVLYVVDVLCRSVWLLPKSTPVAKPVYCRPVQRSVSAVEETGFTYTLNYLFMYICRINIFTKPLVTFWPICCIYNNILLRAYHMVTLKLSKCDYVHYIYIYIWHFTTKIVYNTLVTKSRTPSKIIQHLKN